MAGKGERSCGGWRCRSHALRWKAVLVPCTAGGVDDGGWRIRPHQSGGVFISRGLTTQGNTPAREILWREVCSSPVGWPLTRMALRR
jgi:hypothetical protein